MALPRMELKNQLPMNGNMGSTHQLYNSALLNSVWLKHGNLLQQKRPTQGVATVQGRRFRQDSSKTVSEAAASHFLDTLSSVSNKAAVPWQMQPEGLVGHLTKLWSHQPGAFVPHLALKTWLPRHGNGNGGRLLAFIKL